MQEDQAVEVKPPVLPCEVCGSTEFQSVKALMFLSSSQKGEVSIGKDVALKIPITSSTIFEKYHNEKPFSYFELILSWMMLVYALVFIITSAVQGANPKLSITFRLVLFAIALGFLFASLGLKSRHRRLRSKWWDEIDAFKERFVCLRCAHEWQKSSAHPSVDTRAVR